MKLTAEEKGRWGHVGGKEGMIVNGSELGRETYHRCLHFIATVGYFILCLFYMQHGGIQLVKTKLFKAPVLVQLSGLNWFTAGSTREQKI